MVLSNDAQLKRSTTPALHKNWNRFSDPSGVGYLSPEPLLVSPGFVSVMAASAMVTPAYAYAANNPIRYIDSTGLAPDDSSYWDRRNDRLNKEREQEYRRHYYRNKYNQSPSRDWAQKNWQKLSYGQTRYHRFNGQTDNEKYVSKDGHCEAVYRGNGALVTDPVNYGTYNFSSPVDDPIGHFFDDVWPYYKWGNSLDDPTPWYLRLYGVP